MNETPFIEGSVTTGSPVSYSSDVSNRFSSNPYFTCNKSSGKFQSVDEATPPKDAALKTSISALEMESSLNMSVDSCCQKRRNSVSSPVTCLNKEPDVSGTPLPYGDVSRKIDFDAKPNFSSVSTKLDSGVSAMSKRLHICCRLCKTPLGLSKSEQFVMCDSICSSKSHLESLRNRILKGHQMGASEGIRVLVTEMTSVEEQIWKTKVEDGVWCEKDGCVYNTVMCPFCPHHHLLGVNIVATDASNAHLLNKARDVALIFT